MLSVHLIKRRSISLTDLQYYIKHSHCFSVSTKDASTSTDETIGHYHHEQSCPGHNVEIVSYKQFYNLIQSHNWKAVAFIHSINSVLFFSAHAVVNSIKVIV